MATAHLDSSDSDTTLLFVREKGWLNRFCQDDNTQVCASGIRVGANNIRKRSITVSQNPTQVSPYTAATKKDLSLRPVLPVLQHLEIPMFI